MRQDIILSYLAVTTVSISCVWHYEAEQEAILRIRLKLISSYGLRIWLWLPPLLSQNEYKTGSVPGKLFFHILCCLPLLLAGGKITTPSSVQSNGGQKKQKHKLSRSWNTFSLTINTKQIKICLINKVFINLRYKIKKYFKTNLL